MVMTSQFSNLFKTKKNVLIWSGVLTLALALFVALGYSDSCYTAHWCYVLFQSYGALNYLLYLIWAPIVLAFLGLVWILDGRIFTTWINFTIRWVVLFGISAVLIPNNAGSGFISVPIKLYVLFGLGAFYILISLAIILIQSIRVYWLKK